MVVSYSYGYGSATVMEPKDQDDPGKWNQRTKTIQDCGPRNQDVPGSRNPRPITTVNFFTRREDRRSKCQASQEIRAATLSGAPYVAVMHTQGGVHVHLHVQRRRRQPPTPLSMHTGSMRRTLSIMDPGAVTLAAHLLCVPVAAGHT